MSEVYTEVFNVISQPPVKDYVPFSWASLVQVKKEHYKALAHFYVALAILDSNGEFSNKTLETLQFLHEEEEDKAATLIEIRVPKNQNEKRYLGMDVYVVVMMLLGLTEIVLQYILCRIL